MPLVQRTELTTGSQFPPERERARYQAMDKNYSLSQRVYVKQANDAEAANRRLKPNIYRFLMNFWKDAVVSDAPVIEYADSARVQAIIEEMTAKLVLATEQAVEDMVRYGIGVFINRVPMVPQIIDPRYWFPIREAYDFMSGMTDIVAYTYRVAPSGSPDRIVIAIYENGRAAISHHRLDGLTVGETLRTDEVETGVPAIVPVRLGNGFYGESDFTDAEEYVNEIHRRETAISIALDKQANPHLALPDSAVSLDEQGRALVDINGMVIPVPENGATPSYVVWDASFEAQQTGIRRAEDRVLRLSGISPILVESDISPGQIVTGAALRRLAIPTVQKIKNMRQSLNEALRDVIVGQFSLIGTSGGEVQRVDRDAISITWPTELSAGLIDEAEGLAQLLDSNVLDRTTVIQLLNRVTRAEAELIEDEANDDAE